MNDEADSVPGYVVAGVILREIETLRDRHPDISEEELEYAAAAAAVRLKVSYSIKERL